MKLPIIFPKPINIESVKGFLVSVSLFICLSSCNSRKNEINWGVAKIDSEISKDPIYSQLDTQREVSLFEKDTSKKRSSDVAYFNGEKLDTTSPAFSKFNRCHAYFLSSDTLIISIGYGNGFVDEGFKLYFVDSMINTKPYYSDDVFFPDEREPDYTILYQRLTLDKPKYKNGDSLFGRIEFRSIGIDMFNQKSEQFGIGNFRAKIGSR